MYQCKYCDKLIKLCPDCIIKPQQNQVMHYSFKSTPTATLKSRTQTITKSNQPSSIPGPGDYNVKKPLPKAGTIAQTNQKRQLFKTINYGPGPGSYEPPSYISSGQKRSMSARFFRPPPKIPGPAEYDTNHLNNRNKQPVYSIGNKSKSPQKIIEDHNTYKPSPGLYQSKSTFNKSAGVIFGSSNRKDLTETERTPAPNYYTSEKDMQVSSLNPRCSIGTEKRQLKIKIVEATPGPAKYQKKTFFEQNKDLKKGFTCRPKIRDLIAEQISRFPAPGQYKSEILNFKHSAPRLATTQSKRITFIDQVQSAKKDIPAFSKEQTNFFSSSRYRATSAFSLGSSKRRPLDENQRTPGPVAYSNDRLHVMNRQPAFSCTKTVPKNEFLKIVDPQNPGPGMYDSKIDLVKSNTSSVIVMKEKRPDFQHQRKKPGPGQYNLIKQHQPKFGWTKQKRISFTDQKSQAKHGTHYELDANFSKPPSYMRVESKIKYSPTKSGMASTGGF